MRILGVDPGLRRTGYGVIEVKGKRVEVVQAGVILSKKEKLSERLKEIYEGVLEVLEENRVDEVVVESLYSDYRYPRTAILMGHARGMVFLASAMCGIEVKSYPATKVKEAVAGNGHASKQQVQRSIQMRLGLEQLPKPLDVSDALAVALCHFQRLFDSQAHSKFTKKDRR